MTWLVMTGRAAITTLMGAAVVLASSNLWIDPVQAAQAAPQVGTSFTCQFENGPRSGQSESYAIMSGPPISAGVPCTDGQGSTGVVIPERPVQPPVVVPSPPPPIVPPGSPREETTFTCRFDSGPRAGQTQNYAGVTGIRSFPVGAPCTDGQGSTGIAISEPPVPPPLPPAPPTSFTCQFNNGPRAGQVQSYAGVTGIQPMLVGTQCTDGQGSTGVAVPDASVRPPEPLPLPPQSSGPPPLPPLQPLPGAPPPPPPHRVATSTDAIRSAAVGAAVGGLPGAVWADPNNTGYVTGYTYKGRYHRGAPPRYGTNSRAVVTAAVSRPVPGADGGAVPVAVSVPADAMVGRPVSGLPGAVWADVNNDGVADGYVEDGRYFPGAPPADTGSGAPFSAPAPPPVPPPLIRSGERG